MTCRAVGEVEEVGRRLQAGDLQWRPGPALTLTAEGTKLSWAGTARCARRRGVRHDRQPGQRDGEAQFHPVPLIRRAPHQRHRADKDKQRLLPLSRRKDASSAPADSRIGDMVAAPKSRATSRAWPPDDCRLGPWPRARTGRDVLRRPRLAFPNPRRDRRPLTHPKSVELAKCDNRPAVSTANRTGRITGMLDRAENVQESEDEQDGLE